MVTEVAVAGVVTAELPAAALATRLATTVDHAPEDRLLVAMHLVLLLRR